MEQPAAKSVQITAMLREWSDGKQTALDALLPLVYDELRRQAARVLRRERVNHTLQTTALIHETYLKLIDQNEVDWQNRAHFFGIAAQAMRRILIDHAKARHREKRGGAAENLPLEEAAQAFISKKECSRKPLNQPKKRINFPASALIQSRSPVTL